MFLCEVQCLINFSTTDWSIGFNIHGSLRIIYSPVNFDLYLHLWSKEWLPVGNRPKYKQTLEVYMEAVDVNGETRPHNLKNLQLIAHYTGRRSSPYTWIGLTDLRYMRYSCLKAEIINESTSFPNCLPWFSFRSFA